MRLSEIKAELWQLQKRINVLEEERRSILSHEFIEVYGIMKDDVELSTGNGKPWFGHTDKFIKWLKAANVMKGFVEWNGKIYYMRDFLDGKICLDACTMIQDLSK